jgi:type VI secretion system protein VasD
VNRRSAATASLALALAACGGQPPPTAFDLTATAAADANGGAPVQLGVYQLTNPTLFDTADYFELADAGAGGLDGTVAAVDRIVLAPGAETDLDREVPADVTHLGVVAAFRELAGADWRGVVPLETGGVNSVAASVGGRTLTLAVDED